MPNPWEFADRLSELLSKIAAAQADRLSSEQQDRRLAALAAGYRKTMDWVDAGCPNPKGRPNEK